MNDTTFLDSVDKLVLSNSYGANIMSQQQKVQTTPLDNNLNNNHKVRV